jgi:hypothetical protein
LPFGVTARQVGGGGAAAPRKPPPVARGPGATVGKIGGIASIDYHRREGAYINWYLFVA